MRTRWFVVLAGIGAFAPACTGEISPERGANATPDTGARGSLGGAAPAPGGGASGAIGLAPRSGLRRLSRAELDATLRDLLLDTSKPASKALPEENVPIFFGFDDDYEHNREASAAYVEAVETMVAETVDAAMADPARRAKIVPCAPSGPSDRACLDRLVTSFGRSALRRPLDDDERALYGAFASLASEGNDFWLGARGVLRAMLTGPEFLFRVELGKPIAAGVFALTPYELATRLSYTLVGSTPDPALLDDAASGKLATPAGVRAAAERLLADPRAKERVHHFHAYWLGYAGTLPPDLAAAMNEETNGLLDDVVFDRRADYREVFQSKRTFVGDALRKHYVDLAAPAAGKAGWVDYGTSGRKGILSHGSVLSAFKSGDDTSPTKRGRFVRLRLLCDVIDDPPPNVSIDVSAAATTCKTGPKGFFAVAHQGAACKSCHQQMDPIGFGLEKYDTRGQLRTHDDGKPECEIDSRGTVVTEVGGQSQQLAFDGPGELADLVLGTGKLEPCVARHVWRFALGRMEDDSEEAAIATLAKGFATKRDLQSLLIDVVTSPAFGLRREEP